MTNAFGSLGTLEILLSHCDDDATISHNDENITACEHDLHLRDIERSHGQVARERRRGNNVQSKKVRALRFLRPAWLRSSLASLLVIRNREVARVKSITFLSNRVRSLFGEPVSVRNSEENSSYLHTKQRPLCLYIFLFTHFNQPLTINNIAALTRGSAQCFSFSSS